MGKQRQNKNNSSKHFLENCDSSINTISLNSVGQENENGGKQSFSRNKRKSNNPKKNVHNKIVFAPSNANTSPK
jgi:hypothetical protein